MTTPSTEIRSPSSAHACGIRRATLVDAAALSAFAAHTFIDTYASHYQPADLDVHLASSFNVAQQVRELADADVITLLACSGAQPAAYAQVRRTLPPPCIANAAAIELHRFYVDRCWHGSGISQRLLTEVRLAALEYGGSTLWLKVWERNQRAIAFYAKMGFVDVGTAAFVVGSDRQTDRVLSLNLRT